MRNLTIRRAKSFAGCLAKMKIYIEDYSSSEIKINNIPCRKIGDIKNGEEKTFQIAEQSAKIYVIADKLSKDYCNEYYQLPEGQDDIFLSGKNKFNPAVGNAFRFDNNEYDDVLLHRKKGSRKGLIILILGMIAGLLFGYLVGAGLFSDRTVESKTFYSDGMSITLTNEFSEVDVENYTVAYGSSDVAVFALQEPFSTIEGFEDYTLEQYGEAVLLNNGLASSELKTDGDLMLFEYEFTNDETNETYKYFSYLYKADDAFWLIQFATLVDNAESYSQQISEWANSVMFEAQA